MNIDSYIQDVMQEKHLPGIAVAVAQKEHVAFMKAYGYANLELRVPLSEQSIFPIASITKTFTATLIMLLVQEEKIDLDMSIRHYFESTPTAWQHITVRHLLNHTSGIVRDGIPAYWDTPSAIHTNYACQHMFELIKGCALDFAPGYQKGYSNSAYFLLGLLIEQITGQAYDVVLQEKICKPLQLKATSLNNTQYIIPNRTSGYIWNGNTWENAPFVGLNHHFANAGLLSSLHDLLVWSEALQQNTLVSEPYAQHMWTPTLLRDGRKTDTGLGWMIKTYKNQRLIEHSGLFPGFDCYFGFFPKQETTCIVLTNLYFAETRDIGRHIVDAYLVL